MELKLLRLVVSVVRMTLLQTLFNLHVKLRCHRALAWYHLLDAKRWVCKYLWIHWLCPELVPANITITNINKIFLIMTNMTRNV